MGSAGLPRVRESFEQKQGRLASCTLPKTFNHGRRRLGVDASSCGKSHELNEAAGGRGGRI